MMKTEIILYDSPEAAHPATVDGWVSRKGFFHKDEHLARWDGCTHRVCECGNLTNKSYAKCEDCRAKEEKAIYDKRPFQAYNGEVVFSEYCQEYFYDEDDIENYCEDSEINPDELMLRVCEPNFLPEVEIDYWEDIVPEDRYLEDILSSEIMTALENLNKTIRESKQVISWEPGKYRTSYIGERI